MLLQRLWSVPATVALMLSPAIAQAQSCPSLAEQRAALQGRMAKLVADYAGTHFVIGMCAAGASDTYDKTHDSDQANSTFAGCALIGCAFAGFDACATVATQWFQMYVADEELKRRLRGC